MQAKGIKQQWVLYIGYSFQEELSRNKAHLSARPKGLTGNITFRCYIYMSHLQLAWSLISFAHAYSYVGITSFRCYHTFSILFIHSKAIHKGSLTMIQGIVLQSLLFFTFSSWYRQVGVWYYNLRSGYCYVATCLQL